MGKLAEQVLDRKRAIRNRELSQMQSVNAHPTHWIWFCGVCDTVNPIPEMYSQDTVTCYKCCGRYELKDYPLITE